MLKVVAIVDKLGTAIDRLAKGVERYNSNIEYKVLDCHPKKASPEQLQAIETECQDADIIDFQYYKTALMLLERYPWLKEKKKLLSIYNPYCLEESDWGDFDLVTAPNKEIYENLGKITTSPVEYVPLTVDHEFWTYNQDWQPSKNILMVANRIESKKGILPVAKACRQAGLNFHLVGAISDANYFNEVVQEGAFFHQQISDEELRDLYYNSTVLVCNSVADFESGTLPALEAMMCGTPILSRPVGHMPELYNGENMVIHEGEPDDIEAIKNLLLGMLIDKDKLRKMRDAAWNTAKVRTNEDRARAYQKLYRQVLFPESTSVSIVVPVFDKPDIIRKSLDAVAKQTYKNIELIIADDSINGEHKQLVEDFARFVNFPVRYIHTAQIVINEEFPDGEKAYGLGRSRNLATIEATGDILVFADQRQIMEQDCIDEFVKYAKPRYWVFGNKGANKKTFVENLSAIYRNDFIMSGMFNERCDRYGALSEVTRKTVRYQGIKTEYVPSAKATPVGKSGNRSRKRQEIMESKIMCRKMFGELEAHDQ